MAQGKMMDKKLYVSRDTVESWFKGYSDDGSVFQSKEKAFSFFREDYGEDNFELVELTVTGVKKYKTTFSYEEEDLEKPSQPKVELPPIVDSSPKSRKIKV